MREPWKFEHPRCASVGGEFWFPERDAGNEEVSAIIASSTEVATAKYICGTCLHKQECLQWGLKHEKFGIWGGLTKNERTVVRKRLNIIVEEVGVADFATGVGNSPYESNTST